MAAGLGEVGSWEEEEALARRAMEGILGEMQVALGEDMSRYEEMERMRKRLLREERRCALVQAAAERRLFKRARWAQYLHGRIERGRADRGGEHSDLHEVLQGVLCRSSVKWH